MWTWHHGFCWQHKWVLHAVEQWTHVKNSGPLFLQTFLLSLQIHSSTVYSGRLAYSFRNFRTLVSLVLVYFGFYSNPLYWRSSDGNLNWKAARTYEGGHYLSDVPSFPCCHSIKCLKAVLLNHEAVNSSSALTLKYVIHKCSNVHMLHHKFLLFPVSISMLITIWLKQFYCCHLGMKWFRGRPLMIWGGAEEIEKKKFLAALLREKKCWRPLSGEKKFQTAPPRGKKNFRDLFAGGKKFFGPFFNRLI